MSIEKRIPLTALEACTLMAREAVSLLDGGDEAMGPAINFRNTLALMGAARDLGDGGAMLAWVDAELDCARRAAETGVWDNSLVELDAPLPLPDPAMQIEAVCAILRTAAERQRTPEQWQAALDTVRMLTEMDALEDMVLTGYIPEGGFLTAADLRDQLERVQTALRNHGWECTGVESGDPAAGMANPRALLTQLDTRRAERHSKVDEQINMELFRLALGDETERFLDKGGELLPFSMPPAAFKGRRPSSVILRGQEFPAPTWKKVSALILQDCDAIPECHDRLLNLRGRVLARLRTLLAETPGEMDAPIKISDGLYWEGRQDVEAMMRTLTEQVLKNVGYEYWRIVIRCREPQQENILDDGPDRDSQILSLTAPPGSFRGKRPAFVVLHGKEAPAPTWKQVAVLVLQDCYADPQCRERLLELRGLYAGPRCVLLEGSPEGMRSPVMVGRGLYFESHLDSENMVRTLVDRILDKAGYDCQSVIIKCRDLEQGLVMEEEMPGHEAGLDAGPSLSM